MKRCTVVYATPARQWQWQVELADAETVGDALDRARAAAGALDVPWNSPVGIFGALCDRNAVPLNGDRIEIYRALRADPKVTRRERAKARKQAPGQAAAARPPRSRS